jgi:2,5-diketo-D-gluconate reductase A
MGGLTATRRENGPEGAEMSAVPEIQLNNGVGIPQLGLGVLLLKPEETIDAVGEGLRIGYRHIDTAQAYGNEKEVGRAIAQSGLDPAEVFVTSKLRNNKVGFDAALYGFEQTLAALGTERIDLFLIHWPLPEVRDFVETWRAFERIYAEGRARAIGVSNFQIPHLARVLAETEVVPAVNQIEAHPYLTQEGLLDFDGRHGIATEAWSPIAQGAVLRDPTIEAVARQNGRTPAQVVLRWHAQRGSIIFPKSSSPRRMAENFDIFDFALSERDMQRISALDRHERIGPDPDTYNVVPEQAPE